MENVFDPQKLFLNNQKSPSVKSMGVKFQNMNMNANPQNVQKNASDELAK